MTNKKATRRALFSSLLSLLLCVSMLLGTTFAWFTDSVTSSNNIIKSGTLDVEMFWADGTKAVPADDSDDWTDASKGAIFNYDLWEPGYTEVRHIRIANVGTLALKYQLQIEATGVVSKLAEVIDVYFVDPAAQVADRDALPEGNKIGTLKDILTKGITEARGDLEKDEDVELTIALKMQESAGNEYQNLAIGSDFKVILRATQMEAEEDSFGDDYDDGANYPDAPIAMVNELTELDIITANMGAVTLDAGYQFTPTETYEEVLRSDYRYWQADFEVSADRDVPAESVVLAGYYKLFADLVTDGKWVALTSPDDIKAGEKIRLIEAMGGGGIAVHYQDIGEFGNDGIGFCCGIAGVDREALAGTTINVELRLYKTEQTSPYPKVEPEESIVIGTYSYTFPAVTVNSAEELAEAINAGAANIQLADGEYYVDNCGGKTLTISGSKNAVLKLKNEGEDGCDYGFGGAGTGVGNYTFNGITIDTTENTGSYKGYAYMGATFNDCNFVGAYSLNNANDFVFNRCTFDFKNGYFWTWGAKSVTFNDCTFNGNSKNILAHGYASTVIDIIDCDFAATEVGKTGAGDPTAAVEIDPAGTNTYTINFSGNNTKTEYYNGWTRVKDDSTGHIITGLE